MQPIFVQYKSECGARLFAKIYEPAQILTLSVSKESPACVTLEEVTEDDACEKMCEYLLNWRLMEITAEVDEFDFHELNELYSIFAIKRKKREMFTKDDYYRELGRIWCEKKFYSQQLFAPEED